MDEEEEHQLGLRSLSNCDRSVDSRCKKTRKNLYKSSPEDETLGELTISTHPLCREGDHITKMKWLAVSAVGVIAP